MKTFSNFLHRRASWAILGLTLVAYLLFNTVLLPNAEAAINAAAGKKVGIIDLGMGFDLEKIKQQVADYGPAGRDLYRRTEMTLDIIYPLSYALFFSLLLTLLMRGLPLSAGLRQTNVLPFIAQGFDLLENVFLISLLSAYPDQSETTVLLCAIFRMLKWICFGSIIAIVLFLLVKRLFSRARTA